MKRLLLPVLLSALALTACQKKPASTAPDPAANAAKAAAFLADNAKKPGVVTIEPGIEYQVITAGPAGGATPGPHDEVKVMYEGKLMDGTVFDSSYERGQPAIFPLDAVVPGWSKALQKMHPGDVWTIWLSPEQGYGADGRGQIPPNSMLVFKVELQAIAAAPAMG